MNRGVKTMLGAIVGGIAGFGIYWFIGCRTGACPLQSNLYVSVSIWALVGALMTAGK